MTEERWLPVVGYEGLYEVSDLGRVRSLNHIRGGIMSPHPSGSIGYLAVGLRIGDGTQATRTIHRLVLEAFDRPRTADEDGCHKNGNHLDNRFENLRWGSRSENIQDQVRHGTHFHARKTRCKWGHPLKDPNLGFAQKGRGERKCRACNMAYSRARDAGIPFSQELADECYNHIIATSTAAQAA